MASIYKTSDGTWRVQVRKRGVKATRNFTRKVDATAWAAVTEAEIERGSAGLPRRATGTVHDLLAAYHKAVYPLKRYSLSKQYELGKLDAELGALPLTAITTPKLIEYAVGLRTHLGGQGVLTRLCYLREVCRAAADLWDAPVPLPAIDAAIAALHRQKVVAKPPPRSRRPTDAEIDAIIQYHHTQKRAAVDLSAVLGVLRVLPLRVGELVKIEWDDLDAERKTVKLRARKHPDVTVRETNDYTIPLPTIGGIDTWSLIADRPKFLERPFPFTSPAVSSAFSYAAHGAHIANLHLHDLRAFAISKLFEAGVPIAMVAHLSGHKNWKVLQSAYVRLDPAEVARAVEKAAA
jgi:integrase